MIKEEMMSELLKVAERNGMDKEGLASVVEELSYIARDNGYYDGMLCEIIDILYK